MKNLPIILASIAITALLIVCFIYAFSITKNEPSENEVKDYIMNSETFILRDVKFLDTKVETYSHPFCFYTKVRKRRTALLKASNHQKYFSLEIYDIRRFIDTTRLAKKEFIYAVINKTDLDNPKLGTKEKPVSVLLFYTNEEYKNYYISNELYHLGIREYMTYIRNEK